MAEIFNNYLTAKEFTPSSTAFIIVPKAGSELASATGSGSRAANTIVQLHSIYITKNVNSVVDNPLDGKAYVTIAIRDTSSTQSGGKVYPIASNVIVLPHSSFYIEKTITLRKQDQLEITYTTLNPSGTVTLSTVCSGVEIEQ